MSNIFSLIIPTFNSHQDLADVLTSLSLIKGELEHVEIIIVDDGSQDGTSKVFDSFIGRFEVLNYYYQNNRGPAAARNLGAKRARGEYLIFVDDDCLMPKGSIKTIKDFYKQNTGYAGVGLKTVNNFKNIFTEYNQRLGDYLIESSWISDGAYGYVSSRCYSFVKESFWEINGHDETFIWPAAEDRDLCLRCQERKMRLGYLQACPIINKDHLRLKGFIKQNFVYGLGAGLLIQKHPEIASRRVTRYKEMIFKICKDKSALKWLMLLAAFGFAQICFLAGFGLYKIKYERKYR